MRYCCLLLIGWMCVPSIFAENPSTKENKQDIELMEVVVNASRTQTKLKEIPTAVTMLSAKILEACEMNTLSNASAIIPNFYMPDYGSKLTSPIYIRGIGSRINAPSVGMYVDNVPYFEKAAFDFDFFDVQKIEVLRGPQGTLYGRNSMGGLINITTKSPFDFQGTHVHLSAGNYGLYKLNAGHYQQLSDHLGYSIAVNYLHEDGFHTNTFLNEKVDLLDSYGTRLKVQYKIAKRWSLDFISNVDQSSQGGYPYAAYDKILQKDGLINYNQRSSYDRFMMSNAIKLKHEANTWEFTNTLSYQYLIGDQQIDQDFGPDSIYFAVQLQQQHNLANELIFQSKGENRYAWLTGFFAFTQHAENNVAVENYKVPVTNTTDLRSYQKDYLPITFGVALFHQSSYNITPRLTITGGVRLDFEQSTMQYHYDGTKGGVAQVLADTIYPSLEDIVLLPKMALTYALNTKVNLYTSYSTGYKPGGFNSTFEKPEHLKFRKEGSRNFEVGMKAAFLHYLFADFSLFYTNIENQQIYRTAPSGRGSYLDNSGFSNNRGIELTLQNHSFYGFEGMLAYGYTYAEILKYHLSETINYNHHFTPYIPRHTLAVQGTQSIHFKKNNWIDRVKLNVLYHETGELYWNLTNTLKDDRYGVLNAKVSIIRDNVQLDLWGKNLTNTQYHAFLFESGPNAYVQAGKPLQIGVNLSLKF